MRNKLGWLVVYFVAVLAYPGLLFTGQMLTVKILTVLGIV